MIGRLALLLFLAMAVLSSFPGSAELLRLHKYNVDTGTYVVPSNHKIEEPETLAGAYYEGISWNIGKNKLFQLLIAKFDEPTDPRFLLYSLMTKSYCNDSLDINKTKGGHVESPYPGWVTGCYAQGHGAPIVIYAGSVDNETIVVFSTTESPDKAGRFLVNLRVIPADIGVNIQARNQS